MEFKIDAREKPMQFKIDKRGRRNRVLNIYKG